MPSSATVIALAAGDEVGGGDHWVGLVVLLEPHLMGEQMSKKFIHGEGFNPCSHGGDKWIIFWTQSSKEIGGEFVVIQRLVGGSKGGREELEPLKIIGDGGVAFLGCG